MDGEDGATPSGEATNEPHPAPVERGRLVQRLLGADEPVVAVVAPAGYGKSTLLNQWASRRGSRVAWVSCDRIHDDHVSLFMAMVAAIALIEPTS